MAEATVGRMGKRLEKDERIRKAVQTREWEPEEAGQGDLGL